MWDTFGTPPHASHFDTVNSNTSALFLRGRPTIICLIPEMIAFSLPATVSNITHPSPTCFRSAFQQSGVIHNAEKTKFRRYEEASASCCCSCVGEILGALDRKCPEFQIRSCDVPQVSPV